MNAVRKIWQIWQFGTLLFVGARIGGDLCLHVTGPALLAHMCIYIVQHNSDVNIASGKALCVYLKSSFALRPQAWRETASLSFCKINKT